MQLLSKCMCCLADQQQRLVEDFEDEEKKADFMMEVMRLIGERGAECSAPWLSTLITEIREKYYGKDEKISVLKKEFNEYLLGMEEELSRKIHESTDPLKEALRFARIGNYIDFSAVENVTKEEFMSLFENEEDKIDEIEYQILLKELEQAAGLVYIMDNCGEIVLDKIVIRELKSRFPKLKITAMVRGEDALNDATMEDARMAGITNEVPVITNNCSVQGVVFSKLSKESKDVLDSADVILAKGQGNFESMHGCGKNIYYLFLCKCELFSSRFGVERFHGMFVNERRL